MNDSEGLSKAQLSATTSSKVPLDIPNFDIMKDVVDEELIGVALPEAEEDSPNKSTTVEESVPANVQLFPFLFFTSL